MDIPEIGQKWNSVFAEPDILSPSVQVELYFLKDAAIKSPLSLWNWRYTECSRQIIDGKSASGCSATTGETVFLICAKLLF